MQLGLSSLMVLSCTLKGKQKREGKNFEENKKGGSVIIIVLLALMISDCTFLCFSALG